MDLKLSKMKKELQDLRNLLRLPGWERLVEYGKGQTANRVNNVMLTPCESVDATLPQEFMKGEYAGISLFFKLPENRISELEELIKIVEQKENKDE